MVDPYIIIQASGRGSRMRHLTNNKPKALLSVYGLPIILHLLKRYPKSHFIIIGHYKYIVLKSYIMRFAPGAKIDFLESQGDTIGNNASLSEAVSKVPSGRPLMIVWSDLLHKKKISFSRLDKSKNYIGISGSFVCRWSYTKSQLTEKRSKKHGVEGVFIFKNKSQLQGIPQIGEFCNFLQAKKLTFTPIKLRKKIVEVGTFRKYFKVLSSQPMSRPFNRLKIDDQKITKIPLNQQGKELAQKESTWYRYFAKDNWEFLPKVFRYQPLTLKHLEAKPLFQFKFKVADKKKLLKKIVASLQTIHNSRKAKEGDFFQNNFNAFLQKTKTRLDSVATLIPFIQDDYITINNKKCLNPYTHWDSVSKMLYPFFTNHYHPIHGDATFSNTLYSQKQNKVYFIDPRGYFGNEQIFGDPDYDWAKLYYSLVGNYDQFNNKRFKLTISPRSVDLSIESNGFSKLKTDFFKLTKTNPQKIKLLHVIIWLSLCSYAWDDYDSICGAFYKGTLLLHDLN